MRASDFGCDEQAQSQTLQRLLRGAPIKRLEQFRLRSGRDWIATVGDRQFKYSIFDRGPRDDGLVWRPVRDGISEQI